MLPDHTKLRQIKNTTLEDRPAYESIPRRGGVAGAQGFWGLLSRALVGVRGGVRVAD